MARTWAATTAYSKGDMVTPSTLSTFWYICITAGTSGGAEPTWKTTKDEINYNDGTCDWKCKGGDGDTGLCRFTRSTHTITLTNRKLQIVRTIGKPELRVTPRSGDNPPRTQDRRSASDVYQITGVLLNTSMATEGNTLGDDIFLPELGTGSITIALSGFWATLYGSSLSVVGIGSNACRITPVTATRKYLMVDIQVRVNG